MGKRARWVLAVIMVTAMCGAALTARAVTTPTYSRGDIVEFGSYPQSEVTDSTLKATLEAQPRGANTIDADYNISYADVIYEGGMYRRIVRSTNAAPYVAETTYWFRFEPIRWKVLSVEESTILVLSEGILDAREYHSVAGGFSDPIVSWKDCAIREWLNTAFYSTAFTTVQAEFISASEITSFAFHSPVSGNRDPYTTQDNLFLLSDDEVARADYGFVNDESRIAKPTQYARAKNAHYVSFMDGTGSWWLRSNYSSKDADAVSHTGVSGSSITCQIVTSKGTGVRPVIQLKAGFEEDTSVIPTTASTATTTTTTSPTTQPPPPATGIFGTLPRWTGEWWHYLLFFIGFGFIWMWFI